MAQYYVTQGLLNADKPLNTTQTNSDPISSETCLKSDLERLLANEVSSEEDLNPVLAEILAPVYKYSDEQGYTEEEIGEFVDSEIAAYRAERRAKRTKEQ